MFFLRSLRLNLPIFFFVLIYEVFRCFLSGHFVLIFIGSSKYDTSARFDTKFFILRIEFCLISSKLIEGFSIQICIFSVLKNHFVIYRFSIMMEQVIDIPKSLIYVLDSEPGIIRKRARQKILYVDESGLEVVDEKILDRITHLVIPPNWKNCWICKLENGHLQATGRDERNRKQYLYHRDWLSYRQQNKFNRMIEFGESLPTIRRKINQYLNQPEYNKEKVLAIALKLLDLHYLRIGNDFYLSENETYGLTTLRRKHLDLEKGKLNIHYKAKSNKYRNISVENKKLLKLITEVNELPGYEVFRYREGGESRRIDSSDVNQFIRTVSHGDFTAKDFRTWGGTVSALDVYDDAKKEVNESKNKKLETAIVKHVSRILGNTVATARAIIFILEC